MSFRLVDIFDAASGIRPSRLGSRVASGLEIDLIIDAIGLGCECNWSLTFWTTSCEWTGAEK